MDESDDEIGSEISSQKSLGEEEEEPEPFSTDDDDDDYKFPESEESDEDDYEIPNERRTRKGDKEKKIKDEDDDKIVDNLINLIIKSGDIEEGEIITQFMNEQRTLPDLYTKLTADEALDDFEDNDDLATDSNIGSQRTTFAGIVEILKRRETISAENDMNQVSEAEASANVDADAETDDDDDDLLKQPKTVKEKTSRRKTILNATLQGLMGEANLSFARGKIDVAERICLEIIRQNPLAPEPFFTLASIYETRDTEKFLNFLTIAAHLKPSDRDQWVRIAEMHIAKGNLNQARVYYTKAIKYIPKDYDLRFRKAKILEKLGDENTANFTYLKMIPYIPPEEYELCITTAKRLAHYYHKNNKPKFALDAMTNAYGVSGSHFSVLDLNIYIDLLILNKEYKKALDILTKSTNFFIERDDEATEKIILCLIPEDMIPELRSKICVCLIKLQSFLLSDYMIDSMIENIPIVNDRLDLFIDVAEAFMDEKKYYEALQILEPIIEKLNDGCPPLIWLKKGDCLRNLKLINEAIQSYQKVLTLAPNCIEAKFTLASLLKSQMRLSEAIDALDQPIGKGEPIHARLLYEKCILLYQIGGRIEEYFETGYTLLSRYSILLKNREELFALANGGNFYNPDGLKVILQMRNITDHVDSAMQEFNRIPNEKSDLTIDNEFDLFKDLIKLAFSKNNYSYVEKLCFTMITTKRFKNFHMKLEPIVILSCYFNDDCTIGFSYLRELIAKHPEVNEYWNLLSLFIQKGQHLRYQRFVRRLVQRISNLRQMRIFVAHYHLHCCSFKYALNIYVPLFKEYQQPVVALCIAVVFNQLSLQKKVLRKSAALAQAITFAQKYAELRGLKDKTKTSPVQQEIYYNIGRIYHQANLMHLAIDYYEKALAFSDPFVEQNDMYLGLKQEIAFNLHLIYRASGNVRKARQYLYQHIVV